ncbi:MAG: dihydrofolate reductase [Holosporaceae bacterium]|jgi:dihydrofolate reductase|nr:dihydrofolate reductase [Holosporaceae bacterium]
MIKLIAIVDSHWGISKNGEIPWSFREDMEFFRKKTTNSVVVMGKNTFLSLPDRPLKNRINCVISRDAAIHGVENFKSLEDVTVEYDDFWIIGGAKLYNYALENNLVDYALITMANQNHNADKFLDLFPEKFRQKTVFCGARYLIIEFEAK